METVLYVTKVIKKITFYLKELKNFIFPHFVDEIRLFTKKYGVLTQKTHKMCLIKFIFFSVIKKMNFKFFMFFACNINTF